MTPLASGTGHQAPALALAALVVAAPGGTAEALEVVEMLAAVVRPRTTRPS